jgi:arabinogalactan oligomer/maltooligosaccharide transport system permease protein
MSAQSTSARSSSGLLAPLSGQLLKLIGLAVLDAFGLLLFYSFWYGEAAALAIVIAVITIGINIVVFAPRLYPLRWMSPGFAMMILLVVYPLLFTVYTAFTNYSDGHLYTKTEAIALHGQSTFTPEDAPTYNFTTFVNKADEEEFALWLTRETDDGIEVLFARVGEPLQVLDGVDAEPPEDYEGYRPLERRELVSALRTLETASFGEEPNTVQVVSAARGTAARSVQRFVFDEETNTLTDQQENIVYDADDESGTFVANRGTGEPEIQLEPGYRVNVGFENFSRFIDSPTIRGPLFTVFLWTVTFAFMSVFSTFVVGLFMALILDDPNIMGRRIIRSLLIIPYAIPGVISILVWKGMMNPNLGVFANTLGITLPWFSDPFWAKVGILLVNLWLGYPYMMLICSGALQAIPSDIYEAAAVDGAGTTQRFWNITLPLLLVSVGPLLIASFTYNFNNFVVIEAFNEGGPPIPGTLTPAGYTDILISYTYRLAFGSGRGADYGLASAITIVIFVIVAAVTLLNFRMTGQWEEVSENV